VTNVSTCYYGTFPLVIDMRASYASKKKLSQEILKYILPVSRRFHLTRRGLYRSVAPPTGRAAAGNTEPLVCEADAVMGVRA
jgi:hypothetical protein